MVLQHLEKGGGKADTFTSKQQRGPVTGLLRQMNNVTSWISEQRYPC